MATQLTNLSITTYRNGVKITTGDGDFVFDGASAAIDAAAFIKKYLETWAAQNGGAYIVDPLVALDDGRITPK